MNQENKKLVIFDFDGVLVNTIPFCFELHKTSNPSFTMEKLRDICAGSFIKGMDKMVKDEKHTRPTNFYDKYGEEIGKIGIEDILKELIKSLSKDNMISVVSSTPSSLIRNFLIKESIENYFGDILGSDVHHDKTFKIESLLSKYKTSEQNAVFITDTLGDILEANKCNVKTIAVTWGLHDKETLAKGNPIFILDDPRELLNTINGVLK